MIKRTDFAHVEWHRDHAASGWRSRAFLERGEIHVYDDGAWDVIDSQRDLGVAGSVEASPALARARALAVYRAMFELEPAREG